MRPEELSRAIQLDVLMDNFDVVKFEKTDNLFDIWMDEKKVQMWKNKRNATVISYGFCEYRSIRDFPLQGNATYLHVRKRKWFDKDTGVQLWVEAAGERRDTNQCRVHRFLKEGD